MPTRWLTAGAVFTLAVCCCDSLFAIPYRMDAITFARYPGVFDSYFFDINNQGQATGYIRTGSGLPYPEYRAVLYRDGVFDVLPTPLPNNGGPLTSYRSQNYGYDVNNLGQVIGPFVDPLRTDLFNPAQHAQTVGFLTAAGPQPLPPYHGVTAPAGLFAQAGFFFNVRYPADHISANSYALNDLGQVLEGRGGDENDIVLYDGGVPAELDFLEPLLFTGPEVSSFANRISNFSNSGKFALEVDRLVDLTPADASDFEFLETYPNYIVDVATQTYHELALPAGAFANMVISVDESGVAFGLAHAGDGFDIQVLNYLTWNPDGSIREVIPAPAGNVTTMQRNNVGQVLATLTGGKAALYDGGAWQAVEFVGAQPADFRAFAFNDLGQFVGLINVGASGTRAYVASPIPEPASASLVCVAVAALAARRRRSWSISS